MSAEHVVDVLHLLCVGEEIPVVHGNVNSNVPRALLISKLDHRFLVLVRQRRLKKKDIKILILRT